MLSPTAIDLTFFSTATAPDDKKIKVALKDASSDLQHHYDALNATTINWFNFNKIISAVLTTLATVKEDVSAAVSEFSKLQTICKEKKNVGDSSEIEIKIAKQNLIALGCKEPCPSGAPTCHL